MTCDRVVIINKGKIAAVDTPQNLTSQLKGGQRVRVEVQAPEAALKEMLARVPGTKNVQIEGTQSGGHAVAIVEGTQGKDIRSEIAAGIVGKGWPLYELRGVSLSLEDIFLELTTDDSSHAQPAS
jgi:ABC-2 type transport system ATP-binding protein